MRAFKTADSHPQIVDEVGIRADLELAGRCGPNEIEALIAKARRLGGLDPSEAAALSTCDHPDLQAQIFAAAREVKEAIYGRRLVLFAPLYVSNHCRNECAYCAFRASNRSIRRRALAPAEVASEVERLLMTGHKRLLLVAGEAAGGDPVDYMVASIEAAYAVRQGADRIRRINVNVAPLDVTGFRRLKACGIGTYQLFQETYHRPTYRAMHLAGPKTDFDQRLTAIDRAMQAGIDDVGIGVLFGLYDYRYELVALLHHIRYLETCFGVGPHTISVPRLEPAANSRVASSPPHPVSDEAFQRIVAVLRLAVPYTGIIMSTREAPAMRSATFALGVSQISAGSRTNPGGYGEDQGAAAQFQLGDHRGLDEVISDVVRQGYLPSFCTACYRLGRTGRDFMDLAKPGLIRDFCQPNALMTFREYLDDHATESTRSQGLAITQRELDRILSAARRTKTEDRLARIDQGERDLYF